MRDLSPRTFFKLLVDGFPHEPTLKQARALEQLSQYLLSTEKGTVYMLRGFAGTGKTTIIATLVKNLWKTRLKTVLMAPTGRAAKVMS